MATTEIEIGNTAGSIWKSPLRKLMRFFQESRDRWKAKYAVKSRQCKLMSNQVRAVEKSRVKWKQSAQEAREQIRQLQGELEQYKKCPA